MIVKSERSALVSYVLILLLSLLVCAPILLHGPFDVQSIEANSIWLRHFTSSLLQGDPYPHWLMGMNHGAGGPVFYYYAPFPFYVSAIYGLIFQGVKVTTQLAVGEWLLLVLSGLAFFHFARQRFAVVPALLGAMLYMVLPYHFEINLWLRQDLGELANYIWMPLALHYSEKLFDGKEGFAGLAVTYGLLMFSHLPTALLFSIALGCFVFVLAWQRQAWRFFPYFFAAVAIGILLAGIYWVPAIFSQHSVHIKYLWTSPYDFRRWFFPPDGSSIDPEFANRLFVVLCLTMAISGLCWLNVFRRRNTIDTRLMFPCLVMLVVAGFLMSHWSRIVWETAPVLWKVQFPWRFEIVVDLVTAIAALYAINSLFLYRDKLSILIAGIALGTLLYGFATNTVHHREFTGPDPEWMFWPKEYTPVWVPQDSDYPVNRILEMGELDYDLAKGRVTVAAWKPRKISLDVTLRENTVITVRQLYFPNWRARISGGAALNVQPDVKTGLVRILAPAGNYKLSLRMMPLLQESIGAALSVSALLILIGRFWLRRKFRRASATETASP